MRTRLRSLSRLAGLSGALLGLALVSVSCTGADDAGTPSASPTASSTAAPSDPTAAPTAASTDSATGGATYLPVPAGVTLTEPGTELELGESAVAAWTPRQDLVGVVDVTLTRVDETSVRESLDGFDLDRDERRATPYFVRAEVTNVGDTDLGARQLPLYFLDDRGVLTAPTGVAPDFEACPGSNLPAVFAPGESATSCLIFLVPDGAGLGSIMFRPPEGVVPLQWSGEVTALDEGRKDGRPGKTGGNDEKATRGTKDTQESLR